MDIFKRLKTLMKFTPEEKQDSIAELFKISQSNKELSADIKDMLDMDSQIKGEHGRWTDSKEIYAEIDGENYRVYNSRALLNILKYKGYEVSTQLLEYYIKEKLTLGKHYVKENKHNYFTHNGIDYLLEYLKLKKKYSGR